MSNKPSILPPLLCWDAYMAQQALYDKKAQKQFDLSKLLSFKRIYDWDINLKKLLQEEYQALILTDIERSIEWANQGFYKLTHFPRRSIIGKKPSFLQGKNTSQESIQRMREKLGQGEFCHEVMVNYKNTGEEYLCDIRIHPIRDTNEKVSHFLALEKEVKQKLKKAL